MLSLGGVKNTTSTSLLLTNENKNALGMS